MKKIFAVILTTVLLLSACKDGGGGGDEYVGKWVHIKSEKRTMEIVRNGGSYIIRNTEPGMASGKSDTTNIPATLKDGTLQINNGFGIIALVVDKSTGHLTSAVGEFKKSD
jgi:hypothetical protein